LTGTNTTNIPFILAEAADQWSIADFLITEVDAVATILGKPLADVTVLDMVAEGYAGTAESFRHRELVSDGSLQSENDLWTYLVKTASHLSGQYTYKAVDLIGTSNNEVFGPSVNSNSFISSLLRHAQVEGYDISAFDTDANVVGNQTWLGTRGDDVLDGRIQFANGDEATEIFGGEGADTLIANISGSYLVAGADFDIDTLTGNSGNDVLVGYYNQADISHSDRFTGGSGNDTFFIIHRDDMLKGGIPDINAVLDGSNTAFTHDGTLGANGTLNGGAGVDVLDFQYVNGPVSLRVGIDTISGIEGIWGSSFHDTFTIGTLDGDLDGLQIDGRRSLERGDLVDVSEQASGMVVTIMGTQNSSFGSIAFGNNLILLANIEDVIGTEHADGITGSNGRNVLHSGGENDTVDGGAGHDDLHGGLGNDSIEGGDGADYIFDNGAERPFEPSGNPALLAQELEAYNLELIAYDGTGNDTVRGGDGADVLVYSGGQDTFYGGAGDDTYLVVDRAANINSETDDLTIVLEGDFGHDLITPTRQYGVDTVVFEGINRSDVTVNYEYTKTLVETHYFDFSNWVYRSSSFPLIDLASYLSGSRFSSQSDWCLCGTAACMCRIGCGEPCFVSRFSVRSSHIRLHPQTSSGKDDPVW